MSGTLKAGSVPLALISAFAGKPALPRRMAHKPAERISARAPEGLARIALRRRHAARFYERFSLKAFLAG